MYRTWSISLCYNDPSIIRDSLEQMVRTSSPDSVKNQIVMVDQHWPINKSETGSELQRIADDLGALLLDPGRNLGLHDGFNWALDQLQIPDNAMVIGYDPDCYPVTPGWDRAMCDVFVSDPKVVWLSLWHQHSTRELIAEGKGPDQTVMAGHRVHSVRHPVMNSVCGFRRGWLRQTGGLKEPSRYYGGLECAMWNAVQTHGKWVFLRDYLEEPAFHDRINPLYRTWKWRHAHEGYPHDFATFLNENL